MTFDEYLVHFGDILAQPEKHAPYDNEEYLQYAKMNWTRMSRWTKRFEPSDAMRRYVDSITEEQHWIVITEPWCGDAAHSVPQIYQIVKNNQNIDFDIQLRDSEPHLIDDYLTNGGKSIPKLIIRNDVGHDKAVWGPRPEPLQAIFDAMKADNKPFEEIKEVLQKWYNEDKGVAIQNELLAMLA